MYCEPQHYEKLVFGADQNSSSIENWEKIDTRYRLFALHRLAVESPNPFKENIWQRTPAKPCLTNERLSALTEEAKSLLDSISEGKKDTATAPEADWMRLWENAINAEALYTASALALHERYAQTDIVSILKRLKYVLAFEDALILIIESEDVMHAASYLLPVKTASSGSRIDDASNKNLAFELARFVEQIYQGKTQSPYTPFEEGLMTQILVRNR
jgi:hypothetical protein